MRRSCEEVEEEDNHEVEEEEEKVETEEFVEEMEGENMGEVVEDEMEGEAETETQELVEGEMEAATMSSSSRFKELQCGCSRRQQVSPLESRWKGCPAGSLVI